MMWWVSSSSSGFRVGMYRCVPRGCPKIRQACRSLSPYLCRAVSTACRRRSGLTIFPGRYLVAPAFQRQIGDKLLQPPVLILELLQSLGLINVETAVLLAPAIKRLLRRSNFFAGSSDVLTLTLQHLDLPQLGDNLLST